MVEGRKCCKSLCFCVFLHGRKGEMWKSVVFLCVCARSKGGNVEKCLRVARFEREVAKAKQAAAKINVDAAQLNSHQ